MGYDDWVDLHMTDALPGLPIQVKNAELQWGKFYADGNKDHEITPEQVDSTVLPANSSGPADVWSCGREDAPSGSEGSFDLIDQNYGNTICTLEWNCPYEPGKGNENWVKTTNLDTDYNVTIAGNYHKNKGTLKKVDITVAAA
ncbi:uncharacterized protein N7482_008757 [Penicillium canariense]|uniref:Uncharacterized protein n=1 Tax=Penicillium canariense TaxID=189055 RepID=A0A9W9HWH8_9EURO|nr:uncharacterized protein N7482_008757 [Penicillium canariense]KAJ5157657.1 hypothetical protein N7482_008757 [Penicillium canariense]